MVATSYLLGVSTRQVDKLGEQLGIKHISKSQVSQVAETVDDQVEAPSVPTLLIAARIPFVWLDALMQKVHEDGRATCMPWWPPAPTPTASTRPSA